MTRSSWSSPASIPSSPTDPNRQTQHQSTADCEASAALKLRTLFTLGDEPPEGSAQSVMTRSGEAAPWRKVAATVGRLGGELVIRAPKTERSRRAVPLSAAVVALRRKHKAAQAAEQLRAGNQWQDSGLVFTTELVSCA